ncbi:uncharacterized protein LOC143018823 isoform X2 [Oratosquilla oratoria]|uniref:uncharacterized protein LOC143018823 isoform X2 n=1 Tax=Oratosquilla oratoria TaxID=337810 RepID=UPI003F76B7B0
MVDVSSLEVECGGGSPHTPSPGHDHAPDPSYVRSSDVRTRATLEVWLRDSGTLVTNTSDDRGRFIVKGLQPDTDFELVLYASNHNGRSEPVYMYSKTQPRKIPPLPPGTPGDDEGDRGMGEGREGGTKGSSHEDGGGSIAKVVGGLVGGLGGSVLLLVLLVVLVKWRQRRRGGGADVSGVDEPEVQRLNMDPLLGVTPPWSTTTISESTPVMPPPTTSDAAVSRSGDLPPPPQILVPTGGEHTTLGHQQRRE